MPEVRALARGLPWPGSAPFAYYDYNGIAITGTTVATDNLPQISSIDVTITVDGQSGGAGVPSATLVQRVRLPNADINLLVQPS